MSYLRGPDRNQVQLLPPCLDDDVPAHAPARFIDAYAEGLDFAALGFIHARPKDTGRRHYTQEQLRELLAKVEARIDEYLSELDTQDAQAEGVPAAPGREALEEKIALLRERQGRYDGLLGELARSGENEVSLTDADCR